MLKNVSASVVALKWDGKTTYLQPGQTCKYLEPGVELRMKSKFGVLLEHTPEAAAANLQVIVDPLPEAPKAAATAAEEAKEEPKKAAKSK